MNKLFQLSLYLFFCNALGLFFFTDSALSQKREFEVQDCNITIEQDTYNPHSAYFNGLLKPIQDEYCLNM